MASNIRIILNLMAVKPGLGNEESRFTGILGFSGDIIFCIWVSFLKPLNDQKLLRKVP